MKTVSFCCFGRILTAKLDIPLNLGVHPTREKEATFHPRNKKNFLSSAFLSFPSRIFLYCSSCRAPFQVVRDSHTWLCPLAVDQLATYLSFAYCESVCVDLHCMIDPRRGEPHEATCNAIFGEIILPNTFVHILTVRMHDACGIHAQRKFQPGL